MKKFKNIFQIYKKCYFCFGKPRDPKKLMSVHLPEFGEDSIYNIKLSKEFEIKYISNVNK